MTDGPRSPLDADAIAVLLGLEPLEGEGGRFRSTYADEHGSAIWFLLGDDDASALHRLPTVEIWHHYAGAAVRLLTLGPDGVATEHALGDDLTAGERPQVVVPGGVWQGAVSTGSWSLVGTTMAPPYDQASFELADHAELADTYPQARALIELIAARCVGLLGGPGPG